MDLGLEGRVALVTGGGRGIGAAIADAFAAEGCDVAVVDREVGDDARAVAGRVEGHGRRCLLLEADVRDFTVAEERVREAVDALGRLDVLVCNAGITADRMSWKMSEAQWDDVVDVNLKGCFNYARAAAPFFVARRSGKILLVASINGLRGKRGQANYAASKGGVIALAKSLARELGPFGVNVNALAPGMVRTALVEALAPEFLQTAADESALGRLATPEDCANVVVFLCSDAARHVTGEIVKVDGGQYI